MSIKYTGPLPDFPIQPLLGHRLTPTPEWLWANREAIAAGTAPMPGSEDLILEIIAAAAMARPSVLLEQKHWKRGIATVGEVIASIPFAQFKAQIDAQIDGRTSDGDSSSPSATC